MKPADIILVRGTAPLSKAILKATGGKVSHVAMVLASNPVIVIEAITPRVSVRPLTVCLQGCEAAYHLSRSDAELDSKREAIVHAATRFVNDNYGYFDLVLQGLDAIGKSAAFTDLFAKRLLHDYPICSYIPAIAYEYNNEPILGIPPQDVTPANLYDAPSNDKRWALKQI